MDRRPPFPRDFELILASQSPRRHSLLTDVDVPFRVVSSTADEILEGGDATIVAQLNALAKLRGAVLPRDIGADAFVLGTDTVVTAAGRIMGKPSSAVEAADTLKLLSGRRHEVVSGVALLRGAEDREELFERLRGEPPFDVSARLRVDYAVTAVEFAALDQADIEAYVASGEWRGKAGGYAIQGLAGMLVSEIVGEYSNVVGLPLRLLARLFRDLGFDLLKRNWL